MAAAAAGKKNQPRKIGDGKQTARKAKKRGLPLEDSDKEHSQTGRAKGSTMSLARPTVSGQLTPFNASGTTRSSKRRGPVPAFHVDGRRKEIYETMMERATPQEQAARSSVMWDEAYTLALAEMETHIQTNAGGD